MNQAAIGQAMRQDIPTNKIKFVVINGTICAKPAPMTLRILISFRRCSVVKAIRPSKPRQVITIVSPANIVKIVPLF